ncbi:hypothetical protein QFZ78_003275 [Paenibacillus sp. V4I5]|nr:hypothetical protein [Paenibacillus sp. V4I5]
MPGWELHPLKAPSLPRRTEETQYVDVDYIMHRRLIEKKLDSCHGMMCRSKGSEPVAMVVKMGFCYGLKDLFEALLNDPVEDTRDAKWSHFAVVFFDKLPSDLLRVAIFKSVLDFTH